MNEDDNQPYVTVMAGVYTFFAALMIYEPSSDSYKVSRLGSTFGSKEEADNEARMMALSSRVEVR